MSGRHCLMSTFELFLFHFQDSEACCCHSGKFYSLKCARCAYFAAGPFMHVFPLPIDMFKGGVPVLMSLSLFQPTYAKTVSKSRFVDKISKLYLNLSKWFCILVSLSKQKTWRIVGCFYTALNTTLINLSASHHPGMNLQIMLKFLISSQKCHAMCLNHIDSSHNYEYFLISHNS